MKLRYPHALASTKLLHILQSTAEGLLSSEAQNRLKRYGKNILPEDRPRSFLYLFVQQFFSPLIYILLGAALLSIGIKEYTDAGFIGVVLVLNAAIGSYQEYAAQKTAQALKQLVPLYAHVMRDATRQRLLAEMLVPGDIVMLESGDKVPADIRLLMTHGVAVDESTLTGESLPVEKDAQVDLKEHMPLHARCNMLFAGTLLVRGRARGIVVATARKTQLGKIAGSLSQESDVKPPLMVRIERFTMLLAVLMLIIIGVIAVLAFLRGEHGNLPHLFLLAVALTVSAIPEGLPAAITVALAVGMRRMAKHHVVIRTLLAIETLGASTFIVADKTGTLTCNQLTVRQIILPNGEEIFIEGIGHNPDAGRISELSAARIHGLAMAGVMANEASLHCKDGQWLSAGDGVDIAFLVLGEKSGLNRQALVEDWPVAAAIPYESAGGYSATAHTHADKPHAQCGIFVKGSVEKILAMCSHAEAEGKPIAFDKPALLSQMSGLATQGYRVLGLAQGTADQEGVLQHLSGLTFLGMVGMEDPVREGVKEAVATCYAAGIEVAMVTGDHPITAAAVAREIGIHHAEVITGEQIHAAKIQGGLDRLVRNARVFARIEPAQKQMIVEALMRGGHVVAVTGDGVNDAPALKCAHVGIAMGKRGADVAREASDMVLTDDNFSSIVAGVREGRAVYRNIRKVLFVLVSTGMAEIFLFLLSLAADVPMPLLAVQLLWLNLVTNGLQDVALAFEPAEGDELRYPPRSSQEALFSASMFKRSMVCAWYMALCSFGVFYYALSHEYSVDAARNLTLLLMVLFENVQSFINRSESQMVYRYRIFSNPLLLFSVVATQALHWFAMQHPSIQSVLTIEPVSLHSWMVLLAVALSLVVVNEGMKWRYLPKPPRAF